MKRRFSVFFLSFSIPPHSPRFLLLHREGYFLARVHPQRETRLLLAVQLRVIPHRYPTGLAVDGERLTGVDQVIDELAVVALIQVGRDHSQHVVPVRDVFEHAHVIRVHFEFRLVVVHVGRFDFHLGERFFRRVVYVHRLNLKKRKKLSTHRKPDIITTRHSTAVD